MSSRSSLQLCNGGETQKEMIAAAVVRPGFVCRFRLRGSSGKCIQLQAVESVLCLLRVVLAGLADGLHPPVLVPWLADQLLLLATDGRLDLVHVLGAEQGHLMLQQNCDTRPDENGITLENIDVPQPSCLVQCHVPGEERGEDISQVSVGVVVRQGSQMSVELRGFCCESLEQEVVGR